VASGARTALEDCLDALSDADRQLVQDRYDRSLSMSEIAAGVGKSAAAATQALYRIRLALLECIERAEAGEARK